MRTVQMRQFQRNFYTELKNVPFVVTKQIWVDAPNQKKNEKIRKEIIEYVVLPYENKGEEEGNTPPVEDKKGLFSFLKK